MGPRGGGNDMVAAHIAAHCENQARMGRTNLRDEKQLVQSVYRQSYGGCGESDSDEEDFDYKIPEEVFVRFLASISM